MLPVLVDILPWLVVILLVLVVMLPVLVDILPWLVVILPWLIEILLVLVDTPDKVVVLFVILVFKVDNDDDTLIVVWVSPFVSPNTKLPVIKIDPVNWWVISCTVKKCGDINSVSGSKLEEALAAVPKAVLPEIEIASASVKRRPLINKVSVSTEVASMLDAVSPPWKLFLAVKVFSSSLLARFDKLVLSNASVPKVLWDIVPLVSIFKNTSSEALSDKPVNLNVLLNVFTPEKVLVFDKMFEFVYADNPLFAIVCRSLFWAWTLVPITKPNVVGVTFEFV